ncbi:NAD(P)/FAD-dependent oxidoreductase [Streptomyces sp. NPDC090106]|uniref:NAD(P)/FAD-dependent oxidoreductase n=1 Tax=Streptomyces sp. NPDC090106 TaxID=3365946 RepID=UPI003830D964
MASRETYAIVGANLAGGRAAEALRAAGFDGNLFLIGDEPEPPYERPPLSKGILQGTVEAEELLLKPHDAWAADDIELVLSTRVTRLSPGERRLVLDDGTRLRVDKVLLCTGGRTRRLAVPGANLAGVHYLRTLADALAIREHLRADASIVVVGAGFIGTEVAASAAEAGCSVTLLEAGEVPLERMLGRHIGTRYAAYHRSRGVDLRTGTVVTRIEGDRAARAVVTSDGQRFEADCVVVGIGLVPNMELAQEAGLATGDGVVVDEFCQTSVPQVYAAGDVAFGPSLALGRNVRLEHWQNAQNQAVHASHSMLGSAAPFTDVPWFWSDQYDLNLQMSGHPSPDDNIVVSGELDSGRLCALFHRNGRLSGALAVNFPKHVRIASKLIASGAPVDPQQLIDVSLVPGRSVGQ